MTPHHLGDPRMPLAPTLLLAAALLGGEEKKEPQAPLFSTIDLDRGESVEVKLRDGSKASVKLLNVKETRDSLRAALRWADVAVEINGRAATLNSGNYRLPVSVGGVQVDRSEEHTSELQSLRHLVCRLLLEKKKKITKTTNHKTQENQGGSRKGAHKDGCEYPQPT